MCVSTTTQVGCGRGQARLRGGGGGCGGRAAGKIEANCETASARRQ